MNGAKSISHIAGVAKIETNIATIPVPIIVRERIVNLNNIFNTFIKSSLVLKYYSLKINKIQEKKEEKYDIIKSKFDANKQKSDNKIIKYKIIKKEKDNDIF